MKMETSNWINENLVTEKTRGFIYLIINTEKDKYYVGKKKTITETKKTVIGKTTGKPRNVRVTKESNWRDYYGSSKELTEDVKLYGKDKFKRIILGAYDELHSVNYGEAELQMIVQCLDENNTDKWYNKNIMIKAMRPPKDRKYIEELRKYYKG